MSTSRYGRRNEQGNSKGAQERALRSCHRSPDPRITNHGSPITRSQSVVLRVPALGPVVARLVVGVGNPRDGFDVLQAQLHRYDQAKRRAMIGTQRLAAEAGG